MLLAKEVEVHYEAANQFKGGGSITGHLNCFPGPSARFAYDEISAYGIVEAIYATRAGASSRLRVTLNYNLPGSVSQHYHMDGLYTDDFLICNVAVVDTNLENGAIDLLPGTHRTFLPFWKYATQRAYRRSTRIEMSRGDVLLRKSNVWHRGMPNRSEVARPMLSFTFGEKGAPQGDPFDGEMVFYPNWYTTSRAGVLRERVFVSAPWSYSAYRFVKSLRGNKGYSSF
jgi:hypothetical protein